jgi:hypothetical protein
MHFKEVRALLGEPQDTTRRITKKSFNPFYFGTDRFRTTYHYRGMGRVEFDIKGKVAEIDDDITENGNN